MFILQFFCKTLNVEYLTKMIWEFVNNYPILTLILALFTFFAYKVYKFTEIVKDFEKEVPDELRKHPNQGHLPDYPNGWIPILESFALKTNDVVPVTCFGQELAVIRGAKGQVYVIDAYCPHLGANLAVGGIVYRNNCNEDCIRCPFHGWSFRTSDGQCSNIPYEEGPVPNAKVHVWPSIEINNAIFTWYHADKEEPTWFPEVDTQISSHQFCYKGRTIHHVNCRIQDIPENGADVAHLSIVHNHSVLLGSNLKGCSAISISSNIMEHEWKAQWNACPEPDSHKSIIDIINHNKLFGITLFSITLKVTQVGPGYVELRFESNFLGGLRGIILQFVKPIGPMRNTITHHIYTQRGLKGYIFSKFLLISEAKMLERDIMVWNRKTFLKKPFLSKSEKSLVKYRRWYNQFYSENSKQTFDW